MLPSFRLVTLCLLALVTLPEHCLAQAPAPGATDGLMLDSIDRSVDPCEDFYHYACNGWLKSNPIPPDQSSWDVGAVLVERNDQRLRAILERAALAPSDETKRIGDYWAACMDEDGIEARGIDRLLPELARIDALTDRRDLPGLLAHLQRIGVPAVFEFSTDQDSDDSSTIIAAIDQGGLGLPDRTYYLNQDAHSVEIRAAYLGHLARMMTLIGVPKPRAETDAAAVLGLETRLATISVADEGRLDPHATFHKLPRTALGALTPGFDWDTWFRAIGLPQAEQVNIAEPDFLKALDLVLGATSLDALKAYLTAHLVERAADLLPRRFVDERFAFDGRALRGTLQLTARWKRCVGFTDEDLGDDLGRSFVRDNFSRAGKSAIGALVGNLREAFAEDLETIPWMGAATRRKALEKLDAMVEKIGYPAHWRDYSGLEIHRNDALGNRFRAAGFDLDRQIGKIGKPADRDEWAMTPPTVNAYYDDQRNDINFPAGTLQPPYFDLQWDDAVNYGSIGATIGHEMTHGFDNAGRMFDKDGNLKDWWSRKDAKAFTERTQCLIDEYDGFRVADQLNLDGTLTLGENTADNGGTRIAYLALERLLDGKPRPLIDGYTPEQRFFIAYGQSFCENQTDAGQRLQAMTDPHAIASFRVNGVVQNMPEFAQAFACHAGQKMVSPKLCRVW